MLSGVGMAKWIDRPSPALARQKRAGLPQPAEKSGLKNNAPSHLRAGQSGLARLNPLKNN